jgi:hypothetical protein
MTSIESHLTQISDDLVNLMTDDIQQYTGDYRKINIFNNNIKLPLQKIWLLTPKLKMLGNIYIVGKLKPVGSLSLILYEIDNEIKKFREFINKLELRMGEVIEQTLGYGLTLKSLIKTSDTFFPSLTLPLNKKNIFDVNNEIIKHDCVDSGSFVVTYIELSDVWLTNTVYGINLTVLQMKAYPEFDFTKCIFKDGPIIQKRDRECDNVTDNLPMQLSQLPIKKRGGPAPSLQKSSVPNEEIKKPERKPAETQMSFTPTVNDILSIKGRLRSVIKIIDSDEKNDEEMTGELDEQIININTVNNDLMINTIKEKSIETELIEEGNSFNDNIEEEIIVEQKPKQVKMKKKVKKNIVKKVSVKPSTVDEQ